MLASVTGAGLAATAFPPLDWGVLAWFGLVPWIWAVLGSESAYEAAIGSWVAGFVFTLGTLSWLIAEWGGVPLFVTGISYGATYAVWGVVTRNLREEGPLKLLGGSAALWVALEMGKQYGFWTVPTLLLAQSQSLFPPVLQILEITGQWGLSLVIVTVNLGIAWSIHTGFDRKHLAPALGVPALLLVLTFGYGFYRLGQFPHGGQKDEESIRVALVQAPSGELTEWTDDYIQQVLHRYVDLVRSEVEPDAGVDFIIFPEQAIPRTIPHREPRGSIFPELYRLAEDYQAGLVFGATFSSEPIGSGAGDVESSRREGVSFYNGAQALGPGGAAAGQYLKLRPVPYGETQPMGDYLEFVSFPWGDKGYSAGKSLEALTTHRIAVRMGTNICYENLYPFISRWQTRDGASILLNLSNYTWFQSNPAFANDANSRADMLRAVENRRYYLRASTVGYTHIVDSAGRIVQRNDDPDASFVTTGEVKLRDGQTLYARFGDWLAYLCLVGGLTAIYLLLTVSHSRRDEDWELLDQSRIWPDGNVDEEGEG